MSKKDGSLPFDPSRFRAGFEPQRIPLDGVEVTGRGGVALQPFEGMSVWVEPFMDSEDELAVATLAATLRDSDSETDTERAFAGICDIMARTIYAWDILDKYGEPYDQPLGNPDVFRRIPSALLFAILQHIQPPEDSGDRGEGSAD